MTGIAVGPEDVAGRHHVGVPEEDDAVAVGVRVGDVIHEDRLAVEVELLLASDEGFAGRGRWPGGCSSG